MLTSSAAACVVRRPRGLEAHRIILALVQLACRWLRPLGEVKHGRDLAEASQEAGGTHASVGVGGIKAGGAVEAVVRLTVVDVVAAILACVAWGALAARKGGGVTE